MVNFIPLEEGLIICKRQDDEKVQHNRPVLPDEHYMLPALDRLPGIRELVADGNYFVIHAPRQTGKTTALKALVREINEKGDMAAIYYCTLETIRPFPGFNVDVAYPFEAHNVPGSDGGGN